MALELMSIGQPDLRKRIRPQALAVSGARFRELVRRLVTGGLAVGAGSVANEVMWNA